METENKTLLLLTKKGTTVPPPPPSSNSELQKIQFQHDIAVEDDERTFDHENRWNSCCLTVDKRAIAFFAQVAVGAIIICFCVTMLVSNQDCATFSRYSPLLTFVVGILLPAPRLSN